jgi:hypothetical protein
MANSFLTKSIVIDVDASTWRAPATVPPFLKRASGTFPIDLGQALLMLGTLTMPDSLSPASPALFWAWLRYYLAPTTSTDLRITMDFADLDPHQKGILSDDFGVAISTQWLVERLGGCREIVGGRQFAMQFQRLLRKKHKSKAKVGTNKSPDYLICDLKGKWHVLECKGTQSSRDYQRKALKVAVAQKRAIQLVGSIKGEQLAASLYIANARDQGRTHLKVIDPDDPPLIRLTAKHRDEMDIKAHRLAVARAMGMIGLNEIAVELSLPADIDPESELLRPSEASRVRASREARYARAAEQARARTLVRFTHGPRRYEGRELHIELPPAAAQIPFRSVTIRQGVTPELIDEMSAANFLIEDDVDRRLKSFRRTERVVQESDRNYSSISYGDIMYSEVIWT